MNGLEDRLRRGLDAPLDVEPTDLVLARVAAGARRRRQRRTAAMVAGAAATVAAIALGGALLGGPNSSPEPQPAPSPQSPPAGVVDVAVPEADHVFALTADGCTHVCSTLWQLGSDGTWERMHQWGVLAGREDSVEYVAFARDARNGWAWGSGLWSTHDGGRSWTQVTDGPGARSEYGHWVHLTNDRAWSLHRTPQGDQQLWTTPVGSDDWTTVDLPDPTGAVDIETTWNRVVVESASEGAGQVTLQSSTDGHQWTSLDLPCAGENQVHPGNGAVYVLCPEEGGGAKLYESLDLAQWVVVGSSDLSSVTGVIPLSDDRILLLGRPHDLLVTWDGNEPVDVGLTGDEEIFQGTFDTAGSTTYAVTSDHRILVTTDRGENWSALD